ncbi:MAG: SDR family oxidoreductase [Acidobacteriia bacterium]|nr:SDR family oxidoreductase [Terriglobia bacterium]
MTAESVLVTGASTGLGKETALYLAARGFRVYATVREMNVADSLLAEAKSRNVHLRVLPLDVVNNASIEHAIDTIVSEAGGIYAVINNAGVGLRGYFEDLDEADIRQMFDANVFGVMAVTRAVLPHMRKAKRGRILLISSVGGRIGSLGVSTYCSTKFAVEGFGESLFMELAPLGIWVSLIEPGIIKTERWSVNRGIAPRAKDPRSPYYRWFWRSEQEADKLVKASTATPADVAAVIHQALTAEHPKLRYMIGRKAKIAVALRRWLPSNVFERVYFGTVIRRATQMEPLNSPPGTPGV